VSDAEPLPPAPAPRTATKSIVIAIVIVIVAFVSGAASGIFLEHLHLLGRGHRGGPPGMMPHLMVRHLERRLDLTTEQRREVEAILKRHHDRIFQLTESVRPQVRQEIEAANREIEAVLTPEQRERFEKLKLQLGRHEGRGRMGPTR
jgi:Spy/CpxP family protein refolding chaperone